MRSDNNVGTTDTSNYKIYYKKKGCCVESGEDMLRAWKLGNVLMLHRDGEMVNYKDAVNLCKDPSAFNILSELKQTEYESLRKSPARQLRSRNR